MKKLVTLLIAAGLVFSAANGASAVEVNVNGMFDFAFESTNGINSDMSFLDGKSFRRNGFDNYSSKHFGAVQRMRINFDFIMSETLSAHYGLQVGTFTWGGPSSGVNPGESSGGALATRANNLSTREAYLDWIIPNTAARVRMGQQSYTLPGYAITSPVLDDTATGVSVWTPIGEQSSLGAFWLRALSSPRRGTGGVIDGVKDKHDNYDLFGLNFTWRTDSFALTPWGAFGLLGHSTRGIIGGEGTVMGALPLTGYYQTVNNNGVLTGQQLPSNSKVWFAGLSGVYTGFDPFRLAVDFYYSGTDNKHKFSERSGWYAAAAAEYMTHWATPTLKAWYASGDDGKLGNGSERPLTLAGGFDPGASIFFKGRYGIANTIDNPDAGGTWGVSAQLNNLTWMQDLYHSLRVTYFQGTNSQSMPNQVNFGPTPYSVSPSYYMTKKDSVIEVDFDTTYNIYRNLATVLELGYAFQDFDGNVWRLADGEKAHFSNAWRAALNFRYTF